jgi:hypothetical protein
LRLGVPELRALAQAGGLGDPKATPAGDQGESAPPRGHRIGEGCKLPGGECDRLPARGGTACPRESARVARDELVVLGGLEDGLEQAVGAGRVPTLGGLASAPGAHCGGGDLVQGQVAERRKDVDVEGLAVQRTMSKPT